MTINNEGCRSIYRHAGGDDEINLTGIGDGKHNAAAFHHSPIGRRAARDGFPHRMHGFDDIMNLGFSLFLALLPGEHARGDD